MLLNDLNTIPVTELIIRLQDFVAPSVRDSNSHLSVFFNLNCRKKYSNWLGFSATYF